MSSEDSGFKRARDGGSGQGIAIINATVNGADMRGFMSRDACFARFCGKEPTQWIDRGYPIFIKYGTRALNASCTIISCHNSPWQSTWKSYRGGFCGGTFSDTLWRDLS
jgi:hypothetical protein